MDWPWVIAAFRAAHRARVGLGPLEHAAVPAVDLVPGVSGEGEKSVVRPHDRVVRLAGIGEHHRRRARGEGRDEGASIESEALCPGRPRNLMRHDRLQPRRYTWLGSPNAALSHVLPGAGIGLNCRDSPSSTLYRPDSRDDGGMPTGRIRDITLRFRKACCPTVSAAKWHAKGRTVPGVGSSLGLLWIVGIKPFRPRGVPCHAHQRRA